MFQFKPITDSEEFPYGANGCGYGGGTSGFPPLINPKLGKVIRPTTCARPEDKSEYCEYACKLIVCMEAATPAGLKEHVLQVRLDRSYRYSEYQCEASLLAATFILSEYVDEDHPLVKIATLTNWGEFKAAVDALA